MDRASDKKKGCEKVEKYQKMKENVEKMWKVMVILEGRR